MRRQVFKMSTNWVLFCFEPLLVNFCCLVCLFVCLFTILSFKHNQIRVLRFLLLPSLLRSKFSARFEIFTISSLEHSRTVL